MTALPNQTARKVREVPEHVRHRFTRSIASVSRNGQVLAEYDSLEKKSTRKLESV